jgi:hypothetical protein
MKRAEIATDSSAVVGCYTVHIYCCHPNDRGGGGPLCYNHDEFTGQTRGECLACARRAGWWISREQDKALCPSHARKVPR